MSYFDNNYGEVKYPISYKNEDGTFESGLRRPQLGAIHSIASHFTTKDDSAIVVLPTGSGKTAILMMSAYILRCKRALVITPSRLVRNQITEL